MENKTDIIQMRVYLRGLPFSLGKEIEENLSDFEIKEMYKFCLNQLQKEFKIMKNKYFTEEIKELNEEDIDILFGGNKEIKKNLSKKLKSFSKGNKILIS